MDYQFSHDLLGNPFAKCDSEHEALGDWLTNDIATDKAQIASLLAKLNELLDRRQSLYQHTGKIYHLTFDQEEVELFLNDYETTHPEFSDEEEFNMKHPACGFGLVDFKHVLNEWLEFLA
ncbi:hypothetical protein EYS14_11045 [Alteromonadaceae bacterium M269]|nr:hypothetical protein EYS14_11045 [Alteromonadaceae bacterium M269]